MAAQLEHLNYTVSDAQGTADWLCRLFGWHIRWRGPSKDGGTSLHVGNENQYLALYEPAAGAGAPDDNNYTTRGGLNHLGVVVEDIDAIEAAVKAEGFTPESHADYEPGRRFYFHDRDGIEYEIVQYA